MERKDVQQLLKEKMQGYGFESRRNNHYKIIDDDYLVGVWLDHHPYCKGYFIEYGALFLPDEDKMPFRGFSDWSLRFKFTKRIGDNLEKYPLEDISNNCNNLIDYFEYDIRELQELDRALDINIEERLSKIFNKDYVLDYYRMELKMLISLPQKTVEKILKYGNFDMDEIERLKKKYGIKW